MSEQPSLDAMTRGELMALARAQDIRGRSRMTKGELIAALRAGADSGADGMPEARVLGKGRREKQWVPIGHRAMAAINDWLDVRGREPRKSRDRERHGP